MTGGTTPVPIVSEEVSFVAETESGHAILVDGAPEAGGRGSKKPAPGQAPLPPEVEAARSLGTPPQLNEVGAQTLFGEDLISEKSLDEVILSYLAGEGES